MKSGIHLTIYTAVLLSLAGCKSIEGLRSSVTQFTTSEYHSSFEGKYIQHDEVKELQKNAPQATESKQVIAFSGLNVPAEKIRQTSLVHAPEINIYLTSVLNKVLAGWEGPPVKTKVYITNSFTFGPFVDPVGNIYFPLGALENVESEDEIASLLAHEISHVLLQHHQRTEVIEGHIEQTQFLAKTVMLASVAKDTKVIKNAGNYDLDYKPSKSGEQTIMKSSVYSYLISGLTESVWNTAWARNQEDQADVLGLDLLVKAGYAPRSAGYTLQRLSSFQQQQDGILDSYLSEKYETLQTAFSSFDLDTLSAELETAPNELLASSFDAAKTFFESTHLSPEKRDLALRNYIRREYQPEVRRRPNTKNWVEIRQQHQDLLGGYRYAYQASMALADKDVAKAEQLALLSLNEKVQNQPGIREALFNVYNQKGQRTKAEQQLSYVQDWTLASPELFASAIKLHMDKAEYQKALDLIGKAETSLFSQEPFVVEKAIALSKTGQRDKSMTALQNCLQFESKKPLCESYLKQLSAS